MSAEIELIPAEPPQSEKDLSNYLLSCMRQVRSALDAAEVAAYLVDSATQRLQLRAWASTTDEGIQTGPDTPNDLTDHGIDGADLSARTLRDFIHAAPEGKRLATPLHDGESWIGAIVCVSSARFEGSARQELGLAATRMREVITAGKTLVAPLHVSDPDSAIDLPSAPIFGHSAADGSAYAPAILYDLDSSRGLGGEKIEESRDDALHRLEDAIGRTRAELEVLTTDKQSDLYDVVSLLFSTHVMMLTDDSFSGAMRSLVSAGQTPEDAVQSVVASFVRTFGNLREARLAETAQDVRDIGFRLMQNLTERSSDAQDFSNRIVIVSDVLPSDLIRLALGHAAGVIILGATVTAHISILAESLGLPAVITSDRTALEIVNETMILLDGGGGKFFVSPAREQIIEYGFNPDVVGLASEGARREVPAAQHRTADGTEISVLVNVNLLSDARRGAAAGASGIGLYRSEFPFIIRSDFISEEEQYRIYRSVVQSMPGKPVLLRTADIGGDKLMAGREEERNPFLGVRGIRFSLANRDLFQRQLRAMLRAGAGADLGIMFPMVASHDELEDAREEVERCMDSLRRDGIEFNDRPRIGAMVELPSAVIGIEDLAAQTDFLSIGTNDLTMYLLAVDRTNERLSELYRSHHPIVLKTLADIARRINPVEDELSVCGESAADPMMIPFYLGIGIRKLSVAPRQISTVSATARVYDEKTSVSYVSDILSVKSLRQMDEFLSAYQPPRPRA